MKTSTHPDPDPGRPARPVVGFLRAHRLLIALLVLAAVQFMYHYLQHPLRPGALDGIGWNGWVDQGHYATEARAIRAGDLNPPLYQYPMGYPMVGVPFVHLLKDPFLPVNVLAFVAVIGLFFGTARTFVGRQLAFVGGLLLVLATPLLQYTAVPWTTTSVVVAVAWWVYVAFGRRRLDMLAVVVGGLLLGWTYMARGGGEWVLLAPFGAAVAWRHRKDPGFGVRVAVLVAILAAFVAGNALWTKAIFGTYTHPYLNAVDQVGFQVRRIPAALWGTIVFSGRAGDYWPPLGLLAVWLAAAPVGMWLALRAAGGDDRVVHLGMIVSTALGFVVVGSFNNFAASALKYHCLHYLKLWLPMLAVYALIALRAFIEPRWFDPVDQAVTDRRSSV